MNVDLHIVDLSMGEEELEGSLQSLRSSTKGKPLRIAWNTRWRPLRYLPVGGGVAYIHHDVRVTQPRSRATLEVDDSSPDGRLYSWSTGETTDEALVIIVLPKGSVLKRAHPAPLGLKLHRGRVAALLPMRKACVSWEIDEAPPDYKLKPSTPTRLQVSKEGGFSVPPLFVEPPVWRTLAFLRMFGGFLLLTLGLLIIKYPPTLNQGESPSTGQQHESDVRGASVISPPAVMGLGKRYGLVVGINKYESPHWKDLECARGDAAAIARLLENQGFEEVIALYDEQATRRQILGAMVNNLAPRLSENDRVVFFFAGHGSTEELGGDEWGYLIPYNAGSDRTDYIDHEQLKNSMEKMGKAKHQLFILDACFGGHMTTRGGISVEPSRPDYIEELLRRPARQILTAGGADQEVVDAGADGHSLFTGSLLEAIEDGLADSDADGYVTFAELAGYVQHRATGSRQTPTYGTLPGHGAGEFVFGWEDGEGMRRKTNTRSRDAASLESRAEP